MLCSLTAIHLHRMMASGRTKPCPVRLRRFCWCSGWRLCGEIGWVDGLECTRPSKRIPSIESGSAPWPVMHRRIDNPNILIRGDDMFVIDHELAFAFLYLVASRAPSWECRNRRSLRNHVFFYQLRQQPTSFGLFTQRLAELSDTVLDAMIRDLPHQWRHEELGRISDHIRAARDNAASFERNLLEMLA